MNDKKRATNFTPKEEKLLVGLVKNFKSILENKKSNINSNAQKVQAWNKIEKEFNARSGETYRDEKVLRKKYENIKKRTKKKFADEKCYIRKTGGGPSTTVTMDDIDIDIQEILGTRIEGLPSEFDGDVFEVVDENDTPIINDETFEVLTNQAKLDTSTCSTSGFRNSTSEEINYDTEIKPIVPDTPKVANWAKYDQQMLKTKKSKVLAVNNEQKTKKPVIDKVCQWAEAKTAIEDSKRKFLEEEQKLRLKHLEEKHKKEIELMERESNTRIELLKEESKMKLTILELEKNKLISK